MFYLASSLGSVSRVCLGGKRRGVPACGPSHPGFWADVLSPGQPRGHASDLQHGPPPHPGTIQVNTDLSGLSVRELIMDLTHLAYPGAYPSLSVSQPSAAAADVDARLDRERAVVAELRRRRAALRR